MAVWSIIKKSELEGSSYIAPEFYHPDKLKSQKLINKIGITRISNEFDNIKNLYNLSKTTKLSEKRIKIFDLTDAMGNLLKEGIDIKNIEDIGSTKKIVKNNDLIISRLRSYLREIALVHYDDFSQKLVSTEFIVLRQREETKYTPQFLLIYLLTSEIQNILHWSQTGTQHPRFDEDVLFNLPLLDFSEFINDITEKVNVSIILFEDSKLLYSQAEQILLEELGLKNLDLKDDLFYTTTLKEVKDNNRMDTYFFMPKFDIGLSKLKGKYKLKSVLELSRDVTTGQYCNEYIDRKSGIPYIRGTDISNATINEDNLMYVDNPKNNGSKKAKEGDVVTTRVGTIGLVARIPRELEGCIISDNLIRIRLPKKSEISSYYLTMYLNSPFGKDLMISYSRGSVQQRLNQETLKEIPIPIVSNSLQVKMERFLVESWRKRKEAKQLLEQAKYKVEEMIEKEAGVK